MEVLTFWGEGAQREEKQGGWEEEDRVMDSSDQRKIKGGHEYARHFYFRLKMKPRHLNLKQMVLLFQNLSVVHMLIVFKLPLHIQMTFLHQRWGSLCSIQHSLAHHF